MCSKTGRQFHEFCLARQVPHADNQITIFTESIINKKRRKKAKGAAIELIDVSKKAITQTDGAQSLEPARIPDREHNPSHMARKESKGATGQEGEETNPSPAPPASPSRLQQRGVGDRR